MYHWYRVTFTDGSVSIVAVPDEPYVSLWDFVDRDSVVDIVYLGFYAPSPPPEPEPEPPPPEPEPPPPIYPCSISIGAPASAARGETVSVSATIRNVSAYHFSYRTEIHAGGSLLLSTDEVIASGASRTYNTSRVMPAGNVTILVWVERWVSDHWAYDNSASQVVALLLPLPYTKRVTVTAQNTSSRGGVGTSAILEITVGARLRGTERIGPYVSSMSFGPGETKTLLFDIVIGSADVGYQLTTDALIAQPDGGIIDSATKVEAV